MASDKRSADVGGGGGEARAKAEFFLYGHNDTIIL